MSKAVSEGELEGGREKRRWGGAAAAAAAAATVSLVSWLLLAWRTGGSTERGR